MCRRTTSLLVLVGVGSALAMLIGNGSPAWAIAVLSDGEDAQVPAKQPLQEEAVAQEEGLAGFTVSYHSRASMYFPPAGSDTLTPTSGEITIEDPTGGVMTYQITAGPPNVTVVQRQDPYCDLVNPCTVDAEIVQMDLVATSRPKNIYVHLGTYAASTGQIIGADADNDFPADSFFDVFVTVDIPDLGVTGLYNDQPIRIESAGLVEVPPWDAPYATPPTWTGVQLKEATGSPSGYWIREVIHVVPPPPPPCEPDAVNNFQTCSTTDCTLLGFPAGYLCLPTLINYDPATGAYIILACQCMDPNDCHIEPSATGGPPVCVGTCPSPEVCTQYQQAQADGTVNYWCQCPPLCDLATDLKSCVGSCPPTQPDCKPTRVIRNPDGTWQVDLCECVDPNSQCYLGYDEANDLVWCEGVCPDPEVCTLMSRGTASGYIEFWCECHDPNNPPPCGPQGAPAFVCQGACPPDTACVPSEYKWDPSVNQMVVTECECRGYNECRGYTDLIQPVACTGDCPPGEICELTEIDADGDQTPDTWRCDCQSLCRPTTDALDCEPITCPVPGEECVPTRIRRPGLFFPSAGTDVITGTGGEIEIIGPLGSSTYTIDPASGSNLTVVNRQDPQGGGGGGGRTIATEIVQMDLTASDGLLLVTVHLASAPSSTGTTTGFDSDNDFPADSFFDVFVTIDIEGMATGLYNQDPIRLEGGGIYSMPPWDVSFETPTGSPDVRLYHPGGQPSDYWIRRVIHLLPPPPPPYEVLDCDCLDPNYCHIAFDQTAPGSHWCTGACPPGYLCEMQQYTDPTGWVEYWCECRCACGDVDHTGGMVDLNDFAVFALCYGFTAPTTSCPPEEFYCADLDANGVIDLNDFATFAVVFNSVPTHSPPECLLP